MRDGSSNAFLGFMTGTVAVVIAILAVYVIAGREDPRRVSLDLTITKLEQNRVN